MTDLPSVPGVDHHFVDARGLRFHVASAGPSDGPAVVLLHGWPQHWWMWRRVLPALAADGHRALAVDLRGFGWSDAPPSGYRKDELADDVEAVLDALGVGRYSVAGHDWGGWIAQLLARRGRVERLALLNIPPVDGGLRRAAPHVWRFGHVLLNSSPVLGRRWQQTPLMERALLGIPPEDRPVYAAPFREAARAAAAQQVYRTFLLKEAVRTDAGPLPDGLPVLVLHGAGDPVIRPGMWDGMDVDFELVPEAGHFVVDEQPAVVEDRLRRFFANFGV